MCVTGLENKIKAIDVAALAHNHVAVLIAAVLCAGGDLGDFTLSRKEGREVSSGLPGRDEARKSGGGWFSTMVQV